MRNARCQDPSREKGKKSPNPADDGPGQVAVVDLVPEKLLTLFDVEDAGTSRAQTRRRRTVCE